jgi:hypothetical protein
MIDNKDSHIPSPQITFTWTVLGHALVVWQMKQDVNPQAS